MMPVKPRGGINPRGGGKVRAVKSSKQNACYAATQVKPKVPDKPPGPCVACINSRLDQTPWINRDNAAGDIVNGLSYEDIRSLPPETRQRLKDELNSGVNSGADNNALNKIWRAEHEDAIRQAIKDQEKILKAKKADLERWDDPTQQKFKEWFGTTDDTSRRKVTDIIDKEIKLNQEIKLENFQPAKTLPWEDEPYAYVYAKDKSKTIYLGGPFHDAPTSGFNSKAGVLLHEMSHFNDVGGTDDHVYGMDGARKLAQKKPAKALDNADSFEYFMEDGF